MIKLKRIFISVFVIGVTVGISVLLAHAPSTHAANTISASYQVVTIGGTTDGLAPNSNIEYLGYSADGNVLLFQSTASNLPNANTVKGLYEYNIKTNSILRVDVSTAGVPANGPRAGGSLSISETGRYVEFGAHATNLIDGTTTSSTYVNNVERDTQAGTTKSLLLRYDGAGDASLSPEMHLGVSNDGRFVLLASRYITASYPYPYAIDYGDNKTGFENWTSLGNGSDSESNPGSGGYTETSGQMSCDGSFVAFQHSVGGIIQLFDARNNTISPFSLTTGYNSVNPNISCNGRYVLYATENRTDVTPTPSGMNTNFHLVRYDRLTGMRSYIDSNSSGTFSTSNAIEKNGAGGAFNHFSSSVSDGGDVVLSYNGNMYLKHLSDGSGTLEPIAKNTSGGTVTVNNGFITNDGRYIMFQADPYSLGLAGSPAGNQVIRVSTGL